MTPWKGAIFKAAITFGLFYLLASKVDLSKSADLLTSTNTSSIALAILILAIQIGFAVMRWQRIMTKKGIHILAGDSVRYFWLGLFFNQLLPSSIGGDAMRSYCLIRNGQSLGRAALSVLLDRTLGMIGLVLLLALTMPYAMSLITVPEMQWGMGFALLAVVAGLTSVLFMDFFTSRFPNWPVVKGLATLAKDARGLLASRQGFELVLLSVAIHLLSVIVVGVLSRALEIGADWSALVVIVPIATLLITVPVSIAGWGVREGVMVVGLGHAGIASEQALALSILYGLSLLVISLPGGMVWLADRKVRSMKVKQDLTEGTR